MTVQDTKMGGCLTDTVATQMSVCPDKVRVAMEEVGSSTGTVVKTLILQPASLARPEFLIELDVTAVQPLSRHATPAFDGQGKR